MFPAPDPLVAGTQIHVVATLNVATCTIGPCLAQSHGESVGSHRKALHRLHRQRTPSAV